MLTYGWQIGVFPRGFHPQNVHVLTTCNIPNAAVVAVLTVK